MADDYDRDMRERAQRARARLNARIGEAAEKEQATRDRDQELQTAIDVWKARVASLVDGCVESANENLQDSGVRLVSSQNSMREGRSGRDLPRIKIKAEGDYVVNDLSAREAYLEVKLNENGEMEIDVFHRNRLPWAKPTKVAPADVAETDLKMAISTFVSFIIE